MVSPTLVTDVVVVAFEMDSVAGVLVNVQTICAPVLVVAAGNAGSVAVVPLPLANAAEPFRHEYVDE